MSAGAVYRYAPPQDRTQQWHETHVTTLRYPHALTSTPRGVIIGENAGSGSRVVLLTAAGSVRDLRTTEGTHTALLSNGRVALVGAGQITWMDVTAAR